MQAGSQTQFTPASYKTIKTVCADLFAPDYDLTLVYRSKFDILHQSQALLRLQKMLVG